MGDLIRVVYISRASFSEPAMNEGIAPQVMEILRSSRANNQANGIVGMLYYSDGCFFQCLEGERSRVESLYRTLRKDARHHDLKMLANEGIKRLSFPAWTMKYVPADEHMARLLEEHGFDCFDPYRFDHHLVERVLQLMQGVVDPTSCTIEPRPSSPASTIDYEYSSTSEVAGRSDRNKKADFSVLISCLSMLVSLATLIYVIFLD